MSMVSKLAAPARPIRVVLLLLCAAVIASGCGRNEGKKAASQVAAKVDADEITVHQINEVLARTPNVAPELADRAKREVLEKLIDQHLARQQAVKRELDRSPKVMLAVEAARSEILARAYLEQVATALPKPTPDEIKRYYVEHPELFAQRRVFNLEEISFAAKADVAAAVRDRLAKSKNLQELAELLQSRGVPFLPNRGVRAAEQLPLDLLPKVHAMKDGELQMFESPGGRYQIVRLVASKSDPVGEEAATPRIQQFLFNRRSGEAIAEELKKLKAQAKVEYVGEFAGDAAAAEAKAKAQAEAQGRANAESKAKAEAEAQALAAELAKARAAAEARARADAEADAKARSGPAKGMELPKQAVEKGIGGLR